MINSKDLPDTWILSTIGEVLKVRNGYAFKSKDYKEEGILLVRQSNLGGNKVSVDKAVYLPQLYLQDYHDYLVKKGDILIGMSGSIGKLCIYDRNEPALQNQRTGLLVFKNEALRSWVWYFLPILDKNLKNEGKGVAVQNISASQIEALPIPIAPPNDQKRIVAEIEKQFSRLDEAVAALRRIQANLNRYKASVLKSAVEGKLTEQWRKEHPDVEPASELLKRILVERRQKWEEDYVKKYMAAHGHAPKDDAWKKKYKEHAAPNTSNLPALPKGWVWVRLDGIAALKGGITVDKNRKDSTARLVPYLRVANVQRGFLDLHEVKEIEAPAADIEELRLLTGDILFNEGGDRDKLGRGWIWEGQLPLCIHQNHVFRARLFVEQISPKLISWWGNSFGKDYFLREGKQTTNLASVNLSKLSEFPVPLLPIPEQQHIVAEVERLLSVAEEIETLVVTTLKRADCLRQSILKKAFEGNLI